jgi:hypothetical protein
MRNGRLVGTVSRWRGSSFPFPTGNVALNTPLVLSNGDILLPANRDETPVVLSISSPKPHCCPCGPGNWCLPTTKDDDDDEWNSIEDSRAIAG